MDDPYNPETPGEDLVAAGADIAGSVAGAAAGMLFAGPLGALAGAALGPTAAHTLRWMADEIGRRTLGPRERARAGAAISYAVQRLESLLSEGASLRDDDFFSTLASGRNPAQETIEGVVLAARRSFEERKVRHLGYMLANIAVHPEIDAALAAHLLQRAEDLTWRQYVLLAAVGQAAEHPMPDGRIEARGGSWTPWGAQMELVTLFEAHYFAAPGKKTATGLPLVNTEMSEQKLRGHGRLLYELLSLREIPADEILHVKRLLAGPNPNTAP